MFLHFLQFAMISLLVSFTSQAYADDQTKSDKKLELSEIIDEAVKNNPEILAARNRWQSAKAIIAARRALPDPQISYTYFIENVETRVGPQRHVFGAKQTFPFYGKRGLKADVAAKEAEALKESYEAIKSEVLRQVKIRYYELFYVSMIIDISHSEKGLLKRFERIARSKYETGKGTQQNILKVHVEISKLNERLLALGNQKQTAGAMLNTLLNQPADRPMPDPEQPKYREFFFQQGDLFELAKENRPSIRATKVQIEKSEIAHRLAKKDYYPDLTIGFNYIEVGEGPLQFSDNGKDAYNVMFSVNLPIWQRKLSSQVKSASEMIRARRGRHKSVWNRIMFEVKDNYFKIRTARETVNLYKKVLIPQAGQSLKSAEAGYITGNVSFLDLLDAQRILLKIQFGYWKAYTDYLKRIADIERAVGIDLPEYPPEEFTPELRED